MNLISTLIAHRIKAALNVTSLSALLMALAMCLIAAGPAAAANYVVNVSTDQPDANTAVAACDIGVATGNCSLRAAIQQGNNVAGNHTITFTVSTVTLVNGSLPALAAPFTITGNVGFTTINGNGNGCLSLTDSGTPALGHATGATGSVITNLAIINCNGDGISANGHNYTFSNNRIGVDATGLLAAPNSGHGISVSASQVYPDTSTGFLSSTYANFPIQPVDASQINAFQSNLATALANLQPVTISGNVISGNGQHGIFIFSQNLAAVTVYNNMIGTDFTGNLAIGNGGAGIRLTGSTFGNLIGPNNVISGNLGDGINVDSGDVFLPNFIMGNRIGLSSTNAGNHIGNGLSGISTNTKPSTDPTKFNPAMTSLIIGPANLISDNKGGSNSLDPDVMGNDNAGIIITGASTSIKVMGNTIGMGEFPPGTPIASKAYGNAGDGIIITTSGNTIGGTSAGSGNNIAANVRHGIVVKGSSTASNKIIGNSIGVHALLAGNVSVGNGYDGIHVNAANSTTMGGSGASDFNVIAGNGRNGVKILNGGTANGWSNMSQRNRIYSNAKTFAGVGIDLDRLQNATDPAHVEFPPNYANLDQNPAHICTGPADTGPCAGSAAPASTGGNTTLSWTVSTHGPANFRAEFFQINAANENSATSMTFLGEQLFSTNLGLGVAPADSAACSAGRCNLSVAGSTTGSSIVMTVTDITPLTDQPGGGSDWKSNLICFIGDLGVILSSCNVNNTSELSNVMNIPQAPPTATSAAATAITTTTATLNGTVSANGTATVVTFEYGLTNAYGGAGSPLTATQSPLAASAVNSAVSVSLPSLTCGTTYHFRVAANNGVGSTVNGADLTFATSACPVIAPTATTSAASNVSTTSAMLNGLVTANGATTAVAFEYGLTNAYGGAGSPIAATQSPVASGASNAPVSVGLINLTCNTLYHFRVTANNGVGGTINGSDLTFTTAACAPVVPTATSAAATGIATTAATVNGTVTANGALTAVTFEYGPTNAYGGVGSPVAAAQSPVAANAVAASVSAALSGLTCNTLYHYRVTANNGVGGTINGSDLTFTTSACPVLAPTATSAAAVTITTTAATVNGTVSANGAATTVTFEYGLTIAYGGAGSPVAAAQSPLAASAVGAPVSAALAGLTCNTLYHYRVTANNGVGGTINGGDLTFTTAACAPIAPIATTSAATGMTTTTATVNGLVSANGATTTVTFDYGLTAAYGAVGSPIAASQSPLASGASNAAVSAALSGLTCGTTYHYRVRANNGVGGTINGADLTFTTAICAAIAPTATSTAATALTANSATMNGTVTANGASTVVRFEYGLTTAYSGAFSPLTAVQSPLASGASNAAVSVFVTGLTCNTLYHYRVTANNGVGGTINGSDLTFTTAACAAIAPTATTSAATAVNATTATVNGVVTANGAATTVTFEYGLTTAYGAAGSPVVATQSPLASGASNAAVSAPLTGLTCNTLYHFRVTANNGVGGTINGSDLTFTTTACAAVAPTATTTAATSMTTTTATLNGTVTANGASTVVRFEYGLTTAYGGPGSPLTATQSPLAGSAINAPVSVPVTGLVCNTLYHYRVTANNGVGSTVNGSDLTFTTAACAALAPTATTSAASALTATGATVNGNVSANGASTVVAFEYGLTTAYGAVGSPIAAVQSPLASGSSNAPVSAGLSGLTCNTLYHFRVTANNGVGGTINGSDQSFTTAVCPLVATTTAITAHTPSPSTTLQLIAVTAAVSAASGTPGGSIAVSDGTGATCTITLPATSCNLAATSAGSKTLTAIYSGNATFAGSSAAGVPHTVNAVVNFSGTTATGTGTATATVTGAGCTFTTAQFIAVAPLVAPAGVNFPHGLFDFQVGGCGTGATTTVQVTYPQAIPAGAQYWKYGPTAAQPAPHWYALAAGVPNNLVISGATATFTITDGGLGDDDLTANGLIIDQGGIGVIAVAAEVVPVPTLSQWSLLLLSALMLLGFVVVTRTGRHSASRRS